MVTGSWADELGASKHKQRAPKKRPLPAQTLGSADANISAETQEFVLDGGFKETMREEIKKKHLKHFY